MAIECFTGLVGINSGDYPLTDLPGISIDNSNKSAADKDGDALIEQAKRNASRKLLQIISEHYSPAMKPRALTGDRSPWGLAASATSSPVLHAASYGYLDENLKDDKTTLNRFAGMLVESETRAHTYIKINCVSVFSQVTVTRKVFIYNVLTGEKLDEFNVDTQAGIECQLEINKTYKSNRQQLSLAVVIDRNEGDVYKSTLDSTTSCCPRKYVRNGILKVRAVSFKASTFIHNEAQSNSTTSGITASVIVGCNLEGYICQIASQFSYAMLYLTGAELMKLMSKSQRKNCVVIVHRDDWKEIHDEFMDEAKRSAESRLRTLKLPNDLCFSCNPRVSAQTRVP